MSPLRIALFMGLIAFFFGFRLRPAYADDKRDCVAASEKAQQLKNAGKLSDAREQLATCSRAECPKLIQQDCTQWMSDVIQTMPSVVCGAKDRKGRDLVDVKVTVDNKVVADNLDGKPLLVDPGVHMFKFETSQAPPIEERVVIRQGEKNRILTITFATPPLDDPKKDPKKDRTHDNGGDDEKSSPPYAAYITGGIGIVALAAALLIDLQANSDARSLRETCAPQCLQSQVDDVSNRRLIAAVTAGLGGAAVIAGIVLFFAHNSGSGSGHANALRTFIPRVTPIAHGGAMTTTGFTF